MLCVRPIRFTHQPQAWSVLLQALGLAPAAEADGWREFDSANGRLALHAASAAHPGGTTQLGFEVGDLDEFARRTREAGSGVVISDEPHGRSAAITGPDGLVLTADVQSDRPHPGTVDAALHVLALWMTPDVPGAAATLRAIGARPEIASDSGGWAQFRAKNGGLVAAHSGSAPAAELGFEYDGDAGLLLERLLAAGLAAQLIDESNGRTVRVPDPDGGLGLWISERRRDLYGYHRA